MTEKYYIIALTEEQRALVLSGLSVLKEKDKVAQQHWLSHNNTFTAIGLQRDIEFNERLAEQIHAAELQECTTVPPLPVMTWEDIPTDKDGFGVWDALPRPCLIAYRDGTLIPWLGEAHGHEDDMDWAGDIEWHPNRFMWAHLYNPFKDKADNTSEFEE